ncbi:hypothetical protein IFM89_025142 [Coptis chinensis]|uniref:U6 snRNA phosphodiesterase 1 n=1 Tax=Coptis chinensis TaxID=261450 RepID=A0A835MDH8_9MAGN|nr:hypothetical protein IFM89_025142 [Coptis chinensis]
MKIKFMAEESVIVACLAKIAIHIPSTARKELALLLKRIAVAVLDLHVVDLDVPLNVLCKDDQKLEQVGLGREFHISLGRTVPIRVHQIESILTMLRQKLQSQKRYWIDFSKLEVFVNDDQTRTFLSLEVISRGLAEATRIAFFGWCAALERILTTDNRRKRNFRVRFQMCPLCSRVKGSTMYCFDTVCLGEGLISMAAIIAFRIVSQEIKRRLWIHIEYPFGVGDISLQASSQLVRNKDLLITKQIQAVNEIYRLHNLPEFYKDPRPHISVAWTMGDRSSLVKGKTKQEIQRYCNNGGSVQKLGFTSKFLGIECKIGSKVYTICKCSEE